MPSALYELVTYRLVTFKWFEKSYLLLGGGEEEIQIKSPDINQGQLSVLQSYLSWHDSEAAQNLLMKTTFPARGSAFVNSALHWSSPRYHSYKIRFPCNFIVIDSHRGHHLIFSLSINLGHASFCLSISGAGTCWSFLCLVLEPSSLYFESAWSAFLWSFSGYGNAAWQLVKRSWREKKNFKSQA